MTSTVGGNDIAKIALIVGGFCIIAAAVAAGVVAVIESQEAQKERAVNAQAEATMLQDSTTDTDDNAVARHKRKRHGGKRRKRRLESTEDVMNATERAHLRHRRGRVADPYAGMPDEQQ